MTRPRSISSALRAYLDVGAGLEENEPDETCQVATQVALLVTLDREMAIDLARELLTIALDGPNKETPQVLIRGFLEVSTEVFPAQQHHVPDVTLHDTLPPAAAKTLPPAPDERSPVAARIVEAFPTLEQLQDFFALSVADRGACFPKMAMALLDATDWQQIEAAAFDLLLNSPMAAPIRIAQPTPEVVSKLQQAERFQAPERSPFR